VPLDRAAGRPLREEVPTAPLTEQQPQLSERQCGALARVTFVVFWVTQSFPARRASPREQVTHHKPNSTRRQTGELMMNNFIIHFDGGLLILAAASLWFATRRR
jgi:hypothetical protein